MSKSDEEDLMSIFELSIKRPVFISTIIIALVVFGIVSFPKIGLDMFPGVDPPVATVLTVYPGAGPETVEKEVTKKIEDALSELSGIDQLKSISVENVSQVIVMFDFKVNTDQAVQDVRDKVSRAAALLPKDAETPTVEKLDLGAEPILTITVSGPGDVGEVTEIAKKRIKEPLQAVPGVGSVDIIGGAEKEIKVWVNPFELDAAGLAVTDLIDALKANNLEFPGGRFKTEGSELSVRVDGDVRSADDIAALPIFDSGGKTVRVRDVARVEESVEERRSRAVSSGKETVTLLVRKQTGSNSVAAAFQAKARLAEIQQSLQKGWKATVVADQTLVTKASFHAVWFDMIFGGVLAVLIVFLFLRNIRSTIIAALALPVSVVGTFTVIHALGFTFNMLTMLALTLSIGLLIDDAIVVIENIYRHLEEGKSPKQAALDGAKEIGLAVLATTLSIVAVFLPAALSGGVIGIMLKEFGITVVTAVMISLLVSFTLTPMLSAHLLGGHKSRAFYRFIERILDAIDRGYRRIIGFALSNRMVILIIAGGVFAATIYTARYVHMSFIPSYDKGCISVFIKLPPDSSLENTEAYAVKIGDKIQNAFKEVKYTVVKVGADKQETQYKAEVYLQLTDKLARKKTHLQMVEDVRTLLADVKDADITVKEPGITSAGGALGNALIQFNLKGSDLKLLEETGNRMIAALSKNRRFKDLSLSVEGGKPEMELVVDHERAVGLGVPTVQIGRAVAALVGGADASKLRSGADEINVRVRLDEQYRKSSGQFEGLKVRSSKGTLISLESVARFEPKTGPSKIDRESRQRQITVLANLSGGLSLSEAQGIVEDTSKQVLKQLGSNDIAVDWGGEARMLGKSAGEFKITMLLAIILIYMVLAAQFESWSHPLTIMISLPLSVIGAFIAILLTGGVISIISMIGMLLLMGLVTKNAILLVDYTNTLRRRDGMSRTEALLKAGPTRLRPILMTTFAMVLGMIPLALSHNWGAETRAPMAAAVIGGLIASTLLTLVVVPVIYTLVDGASERVARLVHRFEVRGQNP
jgi:HAE1 family hydrophobic/amphiphilic exporter-1